MRRQFRLKTALLAVLLLVAQMVVAQTLNVRGSVLDEKGNPVIGAAVAVKGGKTGTVTDANGKFALKGMKASDVLVISYIGMERQEVKVSSNMRIVLAEDNTQLDEVMVVAFGKQKRSSFTGSAAVVGAKELEKRQVTNALSALNGTVAGVQMVDNSGDPTAEPTMRIRGISSINAGKDPLIILDGSPYEGGINNINPNDIASMTVLKDAASTALYGARAANGVVMITTKSAPKGEGRTSINLDAKWGANSNAMVDYDYVDNPGEYYEMFYKAVNNYYKNSGYSTYDAHTKANEMILANSGSGGLGYVAYTVPEGEYLVGENGKLNPHATLGNRIYNNGNYYTIVPDDWKDEAFHTALRQEYNLSVSTTMKNAQMYASLGYLNNEGVVESSSFERYTARLKADWQANKWLSLGGNVSFAHSTQDNVDDSSTGLFYTVRNIAPIYPIYVRDGSGNIMTDSNGKVYDYGDGSIIGMARTGMAGTNFLQENTLNANNTVYNNTSFSGYADISPLEGLKITLNGTVTNNQSRTLYTYNPFYGYAATTYKDGGVYKSQTQSYSVNFQQLVNYTKSFGKHSIGLLLAHENYKYNYNLLYATKYGMASYFGNQNLNAAITVMSSGVGDYDTTQSSNDSKTSYNNEGWMFRGQYDYDEKYYGSVSVRRDASSRFHPDNQWGTFYSLGGAWIVNKESWFNVSWIDQLKLKASIGQIGNDNIGENRYEDLYEVVNSGGEVGLKLHSIGNKDITWETKTSFNIGTEFSLWKGRLTGSLEYFNQRTTDMLCFITAPYEAGYSGSYYNVGNMENNGVEIDLNGVIIKNRNLTWSVNVNATHYKNKITKLEEKVKTTQSTDGYYGYYSGNYFYGEDLPMYTFYTKKYAGVSSDGKAQWLTEDGGTTTMYSDAADFTCGSALPDIYGGFGTSISAYGFDFSVRFNYSIGGKAYDYQYSLLMSNPTGSYLGYNFHRDLYKSWTETNTNTDVPQLVYGTDILQHYSDRFLIDASYLALQNINIGYTLPNSLVRKLGLGNVRVYAAADNICYWSKRKGFDPRSAITDSSAGYGTNAAYSYTPVRSISGGISIQF